eukprot:gene33729-43589_t
MVPSFITCAVLIFLVSSYVVQCSIDCDNVLKSTTSFTGLCSNKWSNLQSLIKPTQKEVGFAWVQYKVNKSFSSSKDAQKEMDSGYTPGVIGPDGFIYVVDDHHTLCALDYSGYSSTSVTVNIICDKRDLSLDDFWSYMASHNLAYLAAHPAGEPNALPTAILWDALPKSFSFNSKTIVFTNDPWRALMGFSRKVTNAASPAPSCSGSDDKYCERCMFRGCVDGYQTSGGGVAFFEFRWAYYINDATFYNTSYWPSKDEYASFQTAYKALGDSVMGKINTDQWFDAADKVIALCRATSTAAYVVPPNLYPSSTTLPGYYSGYVKLSADPDCASPQCA